MESLRTQTSENGGFPLEDPAVPPYRQVYQLTVELPNGIKHPRIGLVAKKATVRAVVDAQTGENLGQETIIEPQDLIQDPMARAREVLRSVPSSK